MSLCYMLEQNVYPHTPGLIYIYLKEKDNHMNLALCE